MRVLVVGIDGASPILIDRWIDELPTFRKIRNEGSLGLSVPPVPAQTPVAWTSFMTGSNPGKHGIFSFIMRRMGTYDRQIAQPSMIKTETLWHLIGRADKKVGLVNVPMSDVPQVKGFIIPGFLSKTEGIPHPVDVRSEILSELGMKSLVGDVETQILSRVREKPERFFRRVSQMTDETAKVSQFLAEKEPWDLFMTVFMGTDRIQHFFWQHVDPAHPKYTVNQFTEFVREHYKKIDSILEDFLNFVGKETVLIVLSDHGFCPIAQELVVNNYLEEMGLLEVKNGRVDLEKSLAVSYGYGDIWLNVKGREPKGLIDPGGAYEETRKTILKGLKRLTIKGEKPIKDIMMREEAFNGNQVVRGPDLIAIFNSGWQAARRPEIMENHPSKQYVNETPLWSGGHDGTHDPLEVPGVFGIVGSDIEPPKEMQIHLYDLAPTILNLLSLPVPDYMDGKSIPLR